MPVALRFLSFVVMVLLLNHTMAALAQPAASRPELATIPAQPELAIRPPELVLASAVDAETICVRQVQPITVSRTVRVPVTDENGVTHTEERTIDTVEQQLVPWNLAIANVQAIRVDGSEVSQETLLEELAEEVPVLLLDEHQGLATRYLVAYQPETLVLHLAQPPTIYHPASPSLPSGDSAPLLQQTLPSNQTPRLLPEGAEE